MKIKGMQEFRKKIPNFSGKRIILLPFYFLSIFVISLLIQFSFDLLPILIPDNGIMKYITPLFPVLGVVLMGFVGLLLVYQMWLYRDQLKAKYGQLSYQKIFLIGFSGIIIILSITIQNYVPFYLFKPVLWSQYPLSIFITPLTSYLPFIYPIFYFMQLILGAFFLIIGIMMILRAVSTFGIDYMTVVYLYFPEESKLQDHEIYSVLRHPTYAGSIIICMGGMLFQLTIYSIIIFFFYCFLFYIHIHFVEEKELLNRFGDSYREYRNRVPAFFVRPKNWKIFFKFVIGKI